MSPFHIVLAYTLEKCFYCEVVQLRCGAFTDQKSVTFLSEALNQPIQTSSDFSLNLKSFYFLFYCLLKIFITSAILYIA